MELPPHMPVSTLTLAILVAIAYLLGSIPTGLLIGKMYGIDVRNEGSGNIGATNLYRTLGRRIGIITLVGDCLKGLLPVLAVKQYGLPAEQVALVALAAFCGHVYSVFLCFKGGKGVATALGVLLALAPLAVTVGLAVFVVTMLKWRYVSLGSISAAAIIPLAVLLLGGGALMTCVTTVISLIVIIRHRENIRRLLDGCENKFKS